MSEEAYQVSFELVNNSGEIFIFKTLNRDGFVNFRKHLTEGDKKMFGISEKGQLLNNQITSNNAQVLFNRLGIDLFSMSDDELKNIGLERIKKDDLCVHGSFGDIK